LEGSLKASFKKNPGFFGGLKGKKRLKSLQKKRILK